MNNSIRHILFVILLCNWGPAYAQTPTSINGSPVESLAQRLEEATAKKGVDTEAFYALAEIGTEEAAQVVASYLFDFTLTPGNGHILSEVNSLSATLALSTMQIQDGPTNGKLASVKSKDVLAWQQWAIERGIFPSTQQPYVPSWMSQIESISAVAQPAATGQEKSVISSPAETPASQINQLPDTANAIGKEKIKAKGNPSMWPVILAACAVIAVIVGIIVVRKK